MRRHGGRRSIERGYVLWADCDGEQAVAALKAFEPAPSIVIASGSGNNCHAYWPLRQALDRDELEHANQRLAGALGADPASADAARILRVPGTLSHKHQPPTAVEPIRASFERRLIADDVVGKLPELPRPVRTPAIPHSARADDPLLRIAPEVYVARLLGVEIPRHRKVRCPFHADRTASLHVYETAARGWYSLRPLPPRRHHLRPRRPLVRLRPARRGLPPTPRRPQPALRPRDDRMTDDARWHEFAYEQTDIPAGITIHEWRLQRGRRRATARRRWLSGLLVPRSRRRAIEDTRCTA